MARSLNRITLIGNVGRDPELRTTGSGTSVCSYSIATADRYKDKAGEWQESTDWHNIVAWERLAEISAEYLSKGSRIYIEGRVKHRQYDDKEGNTKYVSEVIAQTMIMLDAKEGGDKKQYSQEDAKAPF